MAVTLSSSAYFAVDTVTAGHEFVSASDVQDCTGISDSGCLQEEDAISFYEYERQYLKDTPNHI